MFIFFYPVGQKCGDNQLPIAMVIPKKTGVPEGAPLRRSVENASDNLASL
jgi:hypothetical protein